MLQTKDDVNTPNTTTANNNSYQLRGVAHCTAPRPKLTATLTMDRKSSSCSLALLDPELDNSDVFDPPAWRPGRYLQFADISLEDEPSVRPVSLSTRAVPGLTEVQHDCASPREQDSSSYLSLQVRGW